MKGPQAEANRLSTILNHLYGVERFPVDVEQVARDYSKQISPESHITSVKQIALDGFEGCLQRNPNTGHWRICYNPDQESQGRVRFTLAHELGHFVLHRKKGEEDDGEEARTEFLCSEVDMNDWDSPLRKMEAEADTFASCLLMPLDDFRKQVAGHQSMSRELLDHCCHRYGVSRMAAALKWIEIAPRRTVVLAVRDGHVLWARSNQRAYKSGCYLPARQRTIAVPGQSLLAEAEQTGGTRQGAAKAHWWFPKELEDMPMTETAICVENPTHPYILGILQMPEEERSWGKEDEEELLRPLRNLQW